MEGGTLCGLVYVRCRSSEILVHLNGDGSLTLVENIEGSSKLLRLPSLKRPTVTRLEMEGCLLRAPHTMARSHQQRYRQLGFLSISTGEGAPIVLGSSAASRQRVERLVAHFGEFDARSVFSDMCISSGVFIARSDSEPWTLHIVKFH